jgi:hypothetical protein
MDMDVWQKTIDAFDTLLCLEIECYLVIWGF